MTTPEATPLDPTERAARQMLRERSRCREPHGSLDDLLFGDATLEEQRAALNEESQP